MIGVVFRAAAEKESRVTASPRNGSQYPRGSARRGGVRETIRPRRVEREAVTYRWRSVMNRIVDMLHTF